MSYTLLYRQKKHHYLNSKTISNEYTRMVKLYPNIATNVGKTSLKKTYPVYNGQSMGSYKSDLCWQVSFVQSVRKHKLY